MQDNNVQDYRYTFFFFSSMSDQWPNIESEVEKLMSGACFFFVCLIWGSKTFFLRGASCNIIQARQWHQETHDRIGNLLTIRVCFEVWVFCFMFICWKIYKNNFVLMLTTILEFFTSGIAISSYCKVNKYTISGSTSGSLNMCTVLPCFYTICLCTVWVLPFFFHSRQWRGI